MRQAEQRERGFESLKYERLYREHVLDGLMLARHAEAYRLGSNLVRPHEALAFNRPIEVLLGQADPTIPNFDRIGSRPPAWRGQTIWAPLFSACHLGVQTVPALSSASLTNSRRPGSGSTRW
jgi:hypothetical protein